MFRKHLLKSYFDDELDDNLNRTRFIQNRIKIVEKFLPELRKVIFDYTEKGAKSRDCVDKIALVLEDYARAENVTTAFKLCIGDFANILLDVGTKRNAQVHAMETQVLEQLDEYEKLCGRIQNELKTSVIARDTERSLIKRLKRVKACQPLDHEQISLAEAEFIKARGESARSSKSLEEQIDIFEKKRLTAVKGALLNWTLAELQFHTKALQLFTEAYRVAANLDVNTDVEEFRHKLSTINDAPRPEIIQRSDSSFQLLSFPFQRKTTFTGNGIPHPTSLQNSPRSSRFSGDSLSIQFKNYG